jgi:hypothetical protein
MPINYNLPWDGGHRPRIVHKTVQQFDIDTVLDLVPGTWSRGTWRLTRREVGREVGGWEGGMAIDNAIDQVVS